MPTIVTPEQADTVLEVNRANAIKQAISKVKPKKTLSKAEADLLQSIAYSPGQKGDLSITEAKTVAELAAALGVSRRTIANWRKLEGAPEPNATERTMSLHGVSSCTRNIWTEATRAMKRG